MRSKNKSPKHNTMRNQEKEGMREEREEEHEEEDKDTVEIFFL